MSIEAELKKEGIEIVEKLDALKVNSIAQSVSKKICYTFPSFGLNEKTLYENLSNLNMYKAKRPERHERSKLFLQKFFNIF